MRYVTRIIVIILIACGVAFGMYFLADKDAKTNEDVKNITTVTKEAATEKSGERRLLAQIKNKDYYLYKQDEKVILTHGGNEFEFENWSKYIELEAPIMVLKNMDSDPEHEIVIQVVSGIDEENNKYQYHLYVLNEIVNETTGEIEYAVTQLSANTWVELVNERIRIEVSQLPKCDKIIQIAMCMSRDTIRYDRDTGECPDIAFWFSALKDENGNYRKIKGWTKGAGEYSLDDGHYIRLSIPLYVTYEGTDEVQEAGVIKATVAVNAQRTPYIKNRSMTFIAAEKYSVHSRQKVAENNWTYTETNSSHGAYSGGDMMIDNIDYMTACAPDAKQNTVNFASNDTEANDLKQIVVTESYIDLAAKDGYTFDKDIVDKRKYAVTVENDIIRGEKSETVTYEISYGAKIITDENANQTMRINLDKKYPKKYMNHLKIHFAKD